MPDAPHWPHGATPAHRGEGNQSRDTGSLQATLDIPSLRRLSGDGSGALPGNGVAAAHLVAHTTEHSPAAGLFIKCVTKCLTKKAEAFNLQS